AQRRLADARETVAQLGARASEARAAHAGLVERAAALAAEVQRLEENARELEQRIATRSSELEQTRERREALLALIRDGERALDDDVQTLGRLRDELRAADDAAADVRARVEAQDAVIREARAGLE